MDGLINEIRAFYRVRESYVDKAAEEFLQGCKDHYQYELLTELYENIRRELKMWLLGTRPLTQKEKRVVAAILNKIAGVIDD